MRNKGYAIPDRKSMEAYAVMRLVQEVMAELERIKTMRVGDRAVTEIVVTIVRFELGLEGRMDTSAFPLSVTSGKLQLQDGGIIRFDALAQTP